MTATPQPARRRHGSAAIALAAVIAPMTGCAPVEAEPPKRTESEATVPDSTYRDGEYTARGWYGSLPSHQDLTLTIEDGTVTEVEITTPAEDETSLGFQQRFAQALPEEIIGRTLDDIAIDRLAGASGCSEGFMNALAEVRQAARAGE